MSIRRQYQRLRDELGSAKRVAEISGVCETSISRILSGKSRPELKSVVALCENLAGNGRQALAIEVFVAFLKDQVPAWMRRKLCIDSLEMTAVQSCQEKLPLLHMAERLPIEAYEMLEQLAQLCAESPETIKAFSFYVELLHGNKLKLVTTTQERHNGNATTKLS